VNYDRRARRIELERGEAFFEVAKRPGWPFIVTTNGKQVTALGTAFIVRRHQHGVTVTLLDGKVAVATLATQDEAPSQTAALEASPSPSADGNVVTLSPGQRVTFAERSRPKLDRPALETVTAWQRGEVILDHTPLRDAVAEMNRYSDVQLKIEDSAAERAQVTGIFRIGDSASFAQAVTATYPMQVVERAGEIVLIGRPAPESIPSERLQTE
jgi:transmembrane sensor